MPDLPRSKRALHLREETPAENSLEGWGGGVPSSTPSSTSDAVRVHGKGGEIHAENVAENISGGTKEGGRNQKTHRRGTAPRGSSMDKDDYFKYLDD